MHQGRDVLYARLTYCLYLRPLASCCCCRVILLSAADVGMSVLLLVRKPTHSPAGRIIDPEPGLLRKVCPSSDFWASIRPIMSYVCPQAPAVYRTCELRVCPRRHPARHTRVWNKTFSLTQEAHISAISERRPRGPRPAARRSRRRASRDRGDRSAERAARSARPPSGPRPSPQRG